MILRRVISAIVGLAFGSVAGGTIGLLLPSAAADWTGALGAAVGAAYLFIRPLPSLAMPRAPEIEPARPVPMTAIGHAAARALRTPSLLTLLVAGLLVLALFPVLGAVYAWLDARPSILVVGLVVTAGFVAAMAIAAFLPPFLTPRRTRSALAVLFWTGAREFRRAFGSARPVAGFPFTPDAAGPWMAAHPPTEASLPVHIELMTLAGDFDRANAAVGELPTATPWQRFVRADLAALVSYYATGESDEADARVAADELVDPDERAEAHASMALARARRALPDGDWRDPPNDVRDLIAEGDMLIIARDHAWPAYATMLRVLWPVVALLVLTAIVLGLLVD